jgi:hypothetical protein
MRIFREVLKPLSNPTGKPDDYVMHLDLISA